MLRLNDFIKTKYTNNYKNILFYVFVVELLLIPSFLEKIININKFNFELLSNGLSEPLLSIITYLVPFLELLASLLLLSKKHFVKGVLMIFIIFTAFIFYLIYLRYVLGKYECSCGGILNYLNFEFHLCLNIYITIQSFLILKNNHRANS
jgi:hypothetical protein